MLSNLALNIRGPWMIYPEQAAVMLPVLKGILNGYITETDPSPIGHKVSCADYAVGDKLHSDRSAGKSIYVTYLTGTMLKYDSPCGDPGTITIGKELLKADRDPEVIGHIIVADSGGGSTESVPEIADAVRACSKPVVAWVNGIAASACIYALSYADRIISHQPTDFIGCIGTMIDISGYGKFTKSEDGYITARIYADQSEEKNLDYERALEGNDKMIKENVLNPLCQKFIDDMKANRPAVKDEQLKGRTYFAKDVVGTLIDQIGTFEDAVAAVMDMAFENENSSLNEMNTYPNLQNLPGLRDQVFDADGTTVLQPSQLQEIESALEASANAPEPENHQDEIEALQRQLSEARTEISTRDARISELESSLDAALARANGEAPDDVNVDHSPDAAANAGKAAESFEEALDVCNDFLKNHN